MLIAEVVEVRGVNEELVHGDPRVAVPVHLAEKVLREFTMVDVFHLRLRLPAMLHNHLEHCLRYLLLVKAAVAVAIEVPELLPNHLHELAIAEKRVHVGKLRLQLRVHVPRLKRRGVILAAPLQPLQCCSLELHKEDHGLRGRTTLPAEDLVLLEQVPAVAEALRDRRSGRAAHPAELCIRHEGVTTLAPEVRRMHHLVFRHRARRLEKRGRAVRSCLRRGRRSRRRHAGRSCSHASASVR
mmetsp:Transcript_46530/g.129440  ORF Transcript_46530/g.129440 Transcript_46530/m.129440 type:complete len:241 (-) Transcript_46530:112-834(-)